ncbi:hypothetical protein JCM3774_003929 [Rhodotorula dairenensis]
MATPKPRINATRPENLNSSAKRTSRAALLEQYSQLLPLEPTPSAGSTHQSWIAAVGLGPRPPLAPKQVDARWDDISNAVWVTDQLDMARLWRQGFFGKGFLSRSEPSWKRRVQNRRAELDGTEKKLTAEEITALRRVERKGAKLAKKLERDAEKLVAASAAAASSSSASLSDSGPGTRATTTTTPIGTKPGDVDLLGKPDKIAEEQEGAADPDADAAVAEQEEEDEDPESQPPPPPEEWQLDAEHAQLQPEEAFFLSFALGTLALVRPLDSPSSSTASTTPPPGSGSAKLSILEMFRLFLESAAPALAPPACTISHPTLKGSLDPRLNRLDSPFLLSYAAYHHFRSLGWVTRSGTKFCVDWVLYGQGGPVGGHAEFAVLIIPTYVDPDDAKSNPFRSTSTLAVHADPDLRAASIDGEPDGEHRQGEGERKNSWRWFHTVNRVCSGVKKTLVLLYVVIPPLSSLPSEPDWVARHPAQALAKLEMREVVVRRFLAGRMRD